MANSFLKKWHKPIKAIFVASAAYVSPAFAFFGKKLPFVSALEWLKGAMTGDLLLYMAIILIVATCIAKAYGEWSDGIRKLINFTFWISIAMGSTMMITELRNAVSGG